MKYTSPKIGPAVTLTLLIVFFTFVGFITENIKEPTVTPELIPQGGELLAPELVPEEGELFSSPPAKKPETPQEYKVTYQGATLGTFPAKPSEAKKGFDIFMASYQSGASFTGATYSPYTADVKRAEEAAGHSTFIVTHSGGSITIGAKDKGTAEKAAAAIATNNNWGAHSVEAQTFTVTYGNTRLTDKTKIEAEQLRKTLTSAGFQVNVIDTRNDQGASGTSNSDGKLNYEIKVGTETTIQSLTLAEKQALETRLSNTGLTTSVTRSYLGDYIDEGYEVSGFTTESGDALLQRGGTLYVYKNNAQLEATPLKDETGGKPTVITLNKDIGNGNNFDIRYSVSDGKANDPLYAQLTTDPNILISVENLKWLEENPPTSTLTPSNTRDLGDKMDTLFGANVIKVSTSGKEPVYISQYNPAENHQSDFLRAEQKTYHVKGDRVLDEAQYKNLASSDNFDSKEWKTFTSNDIIGQQYDDKTKRVGVVYSEVRADNDVFFKETYYYNGKGELVGMAWGTNGGTSTYYDKKPNGVPGAEGAWDYKKGKDSQVHFERWMTQFQGLSGLSNILLGEETVDNWRRSIDESFGKFLGKDYWQAMICESQYETPQDSIMTIATPDGLPHILAHAEGERTDVIGPNGTEYLYKITWAVNNPEQANEELEFNVYLVNGNSRRPMYPQLFRLSPGDQEIRSGEDAIVQYSSNLYPEICINFEDPVDQFGSSGETRNTVCNAITGYEGGATGYVDPNAQPTASGSSGTGGTTVGNPIELQPGGVVDF